MRGPNVARLPADPLVDAVTERSRRRRIGLERLLPTRSLQRAYVRARQEGSLTLRAAEQLCDELGWHPREVWGDSYDTAAFAGSPARKVA